MSNKFKLIIIFCLVITSCNLDFKEASQVSLDINESKSKKVFIAEYFINKIRCFDKNYKFPINSIWVEKEWLLALDTNGNESYKIGTFSYNMVFKLNNLDTLITNENYEKGKWIMLNDNNENGMGSTRGMINISLTKDEIKDTISLSIYKLLNPPLDYNNHRVKLYQFEIIRK